MDPTACRRSTSCWTAIHREQLGPLPVFGYAGRAVRDLLLRSPGTAAGPVDRERPGQQVGLGVEALHIYRWLMQLQQALQDDASFLGGRSFQSIVADNDLPAFVKGLHVRHLSPENRCWTTCRAWTTTTTYSHTFTRKDER